MQHASSIWTKRLFFILIAGLSAGTSFSFFVDVYGSADAGTLYLILIGLYGIAVTDGAALAWLKIYLDASDNNEERLFAAVGAAVGVIGSAVASFAFLLGESGTVTTGANMRSSATIAMAVFTILHFLLVVLSQYRATDAQVSERRAAMMATGTELMLAQTEKQFTAMLPQLAHENAQRLSADIAAQFRIVPPSPTMLPAPAAASADDATDPTTPTTDDGSGTGAAIGFQVPTLSADQLNMIAAQLAAHMTNTPTAQNGGDVGK